MPTGSLYPPSLPMPLGTPLISPHRHPPYPNHAHTPGRPGTLQSLPVHLSTWLPHLCVPTGTPLPPISSHTHGHPDAHRLLPVPLSTPSASNLSPCPRAPQSPPHPPTPMGTLGPLLVPHIHGHPNAPYISPCSQAHCYLPISPIHGLPTSPHFSLHPWYLPVPRGTPKPHFPSPSSAQGPDQHPDSSADSAGGHGSGAGVPGAR